jgi:hypothetical protein
VYDVQYSAWFHPSMRQSLVVFFHVVAPVYFASEWGFPSLVLRGLLAMYKHKVAQNVPNNWKTAAESR